MEARQIFTSKKTDFTGLKFLINVRLPPQKGVARGAPWLTLAKAT